METWAMKRKRTKRHINKPRYDMLPRDLQINILNRLPAKDLSKVMCVSKSWFALILFTCYPTMLSLTFPLLKLLMRVESKIKREIPPSWVSVFTDTLSLHPYQGLDQLLTWCSKVAGSRFAARKLIHSCNGLLLFCHKTKIESAATRAVYHYYYYVLNPLTKKCMAILKPRPRTTVNMYAALAYDAAESGFFNIVSFQGVRQLNVFSSKTRRWTSLRFYLPFQVTEARWSKKSVYLKGAVYRLSSSGHVIKFLVDRQEDPCYQAVAISVPCVFPLHLGHRGIGIRNEKIVFFVSVGACLIIWELAEVFVRDAYAFRWSRTHKVCDRFLRELNVSGRILGVHPHHPIAIFKHKRVIYFYFYCHHTKGNVCRAMEIEGPVYRYITSSGFLLLEYSIPSCLDKKNPVDFQWLPTIVDDRQVGVYTLED